MKLSAYPEIFSLNALPNLRGCYRHASLPQPRHLLCPPPFPRQPMTGLFPWLVHCEYEMKINKRRILNYFYFRHTGSVDFPDPGFPRGGGAV